MGVFPSLWYQKITHTLNINFMRVFTSLWYPCSIKKSPTHSEKCKVQGVKQRGVKLMVVQDDIIERDTQYPLSDDVMGDTLSNDNMERGISPYRLGWHQANPILIHSKWPLKVVREKMTY